MIQTRTTLKGYFETGDVPTESQFADLIDSQAHLTENRNLFGLSPYRETGRDYQFFESIVRDGQIQLCISLTGTSGAYNPAHWYPLDLIASTSGVGDWEVGTEYDAANLAVYGGRLWRSLQPANTGNTPETGSLWWEEISAAVGAVAEYAEDVYFPNGQLIVSNGLLLRANTDFVSVDFASDVNAGWLQALRTVRQISELTEFSFKGLRRTIAVLPPGIPPEAVIVWQFFASVHLDAVGPVAPNDPSLVLASMLNGSATHTAAVDENYNMALPDAGTGMLNLTGGDRVELLLSRDPNERGTMDGRHIVSMAVRAAVPAEHRYAAIAQNGDGVNFLFTSEDGFQWTKRTGVTAPMELVFDSAGTMWVRNSIGEVYGSTDGGTNFGTDQSSALAITTMWTDGTYVYLAETGKVHQATASGNTLVGLAELAVLTPLLAIPGVPITAGAAGAGQVLVAAENNLWASPDDGVSWAAVGTYAYSAPEGIILSLFIRVANEWYVGTQGYGVFSTNDAGTSLTNSWATGDTPVTGWALLNSGAWAATGNGVIQFTNWDTPVLTDFYGGGVPTPDALYKEVFEEVGGGGVIVAQIVYANLDPHPRGANGNRLRHVTRCIAADPDQNFLLAGSMFGGVYTYDNVTSNRWNDTDRRVWAQVEVYVLA